MHNFLYGFMWGLGFFLAGLIFGLGCGLAIYLIAKLASCREKEIS